MSIHQLSLISLQDLDDGRAAQAFDVQLGRVVRDVMDRPADPKPRTVTLTVTLSPVVEPDGTCDRVKAQIKFKSTVPTHQTKVYEMAVRRNGSLVFNEDSPEAVDQTTFLGDDDK